jgi:spore coat polysaccharide biosynthesis protein SpsF (cytidylyltransferase family)
MRSIAIIPTRLDSRRLRRKALLELSGRSILQHCVDRARLLPVERVVVATTTRPCDDDIEHVDAEVFRGSPVPLTRMVECSDGFDAVVRICHDSTIWDQAEVARHLKSIPSVGDRVQYADDVPRAHHGVDVWSRRLLVSLTEASTDQEKPAHWAVTHQVVTLNLPRHLSGAAELQIDTMDDYVRMCSLYADCYKGGPIPVREALRWLRSR